MLPVNNARRRLAAHRLRYQVYCRENPFERAADHPDGLERDEFDGHAVQSLLRRRSDHAIIGAVRLILPEIEHGAGGLPFLRLCRPLVPFLDMMLPVQSLAEVSRFCISRELRHRAGGGADATLARYATLGLIRSLVEASIDNGVSHWCLVVEPALLRFLAILGLKFHAVGPLVEHHGRRQPCHADLAMLLDGVRARRPDVWEVITDAGRLAPRPILVAVPSGQASRPPRAVAPAASSPRAVAPAAISVADDALAVA